MMVRSPAMTTARGVDEVCFESVTSRAQSPTLSTHGRSKESRTERFTGVAQMFLRLPLRTNINTEFNTRGVLLSTFHWMKELQHPDAKAASAPFAAHAKKYQKNRLINFVAFSSELRRGHVGGKSSVTQIPPGRACMQELDCAYSVHYTCSRSRTSYGCDGDKRAFKR